MVIQLKREVFIMMEAIVNVLWVIAVVGIGMLFATVLSWFD